MTSPWQHLIDKHRASLDAAKGIFTWTNEEELAWLAEEASKRRNILEIGTYKGHSAKVLAKAMPKECHLVCFDYCPEVGIAEKARENLREEISSGRVEYYQSDAGVKAVHWAHHRMDRFDMIWIDDGHTYDCVVRDCLIASTLHCGGPIMVCGHDYEKSNNDVARAVNDCFGQKNIKFGPGTIWYL